VTATRLKPLGITRLGQGHTLPKDRLAGEVALYD